MTYKHEREAPPGHVLMPESFLTIMSPFTEFSVWRDMSNPDAPTEVLIRFAEVVCPYCGGTGQTEVPGTDAYTWDCDYCNGEASYRGYLFESATTQAELDRLHRIGVQGAVLTGGGIAGLQWWEGAP